MWTQFFALLSTTTVVLALGDGRYYSKKTVHHQQAPQQYSSSGHYQYQASSGMASSGPRHSMAAPSPYSFGYEAEAMGGSSARQESSDASGKVTGSYSVVNEDGSKRLVKYVADDQGFRADIDTNEPGTKSDSPADITLKSAAPERAPMGQKYSHGSAQKYSQGSAQKYSQGSALKHSQGAYIPQQPIQFRMDSSAGIAQDKPTPYSFNYQSQMEDGTNAHSETSDGSGKVIGSYSLSNTDGRRRTVDYSADQGGFKASVNTNEFGTKSDSPAHVQFFSSAPQATHAQQQAPKGYQAPVSYQAQAGHSSPAVAGFQKSFQTQQQQVTQYNMGSSSSIEENKPFPYSFFYDAQLEDGSSSRKESSDGYGKVIGSYSLSNIDGRQRTVDYTADQDGFKASVNTNEFGTKSESPADVLFYSSAPQDAPQQAPMSYQAPVSYQAQGGYSSASIAGHQKSFQAQRQQPIQFGMYSGAGNAEDKPAPYSFNYQNQNQMGAGSSSHSETSDGSGKVIGSYSLSHADGSKRTVDYSADKDGFKASVNTNEFGTKSDSPANVMFFSSAPQEAPAPQQAPVAYRAPVLYQAQEKQSSASVSGLHNSFQVQQEQVPIQFSMGSASGKDEDKHYSFNYKSQLTDGTNAHSETSDGSGKVVGSYSLSNTDGRRRTVDYSADQGGFKASVNTNEFGTKSDSPAHVHFFSSAPQAAPAPHQASYDAQMAQRAQVAFKAQAPQQAQFLHQTQVSSGFQKSYAHGQQNVQQPAANHPQFPYSFGYEAEATGGSSARQESSDSSGKVTGSYSLTNEDGSTRLVEYIADKEGFRAKVKTNEPGTKSDSPADVSLKSNAPEAAPLAQSLHQPQFPARTYTPKSSMINQEAINVWRR